MEGGKEMGMLNFIFDNWDSVLVLLTALVGFIHAGKASEMKALKDILFGLVTKAEAEYGSGTGALKRSAVFEWIYERMPGMMRLVITRRNIDKLLNEVLAHAKCEWSNNPNLCELVKLVKLGERTER